MLEPLPETRRALAELVTIDEHDVDELIVELGRRARTIVPELVGLSLGLVREGITLTLVASNTGLASLDAAQYVDDEGPCIEASATEKAIEVNIEDLLDEDRWALYAQASAAAGIASTLSMPLLKDATVYGGINLYASAPDAFRGRHQELAAALGAAPGLAVTNADLPFSTREQARQAPSQLHTRLEVETAVGLLMAKFQEDAEAARDRLRAAAARAGISEDFVARVLILVQNG